MPSFQTRPTGNVTYGNCRLSQAILYLMEYPQTRWQPQNCSSRSKGREPYKDKKCAAPPADSCRRAEWIFGLCKEEK